jgi:hypothetical protein
MTLSDYLMTTSPERRNGIVLIATMVTTFVALRVSLSFSPDSDFNVGRYNIHHLYTGLLIATAGGIPVALFGLESRIRLWAVGVFGIGLAMALDECVYLIATDGTNASYLLPVSFWGGVLVVGLAVVYTILLAVFGARHSRSAQARVKNSTPRN